MKTWKEYREEIERILEADCEKYESDCMNCPYRDLTEAHAKIMQHYVIRNRREGMYKFPVYWTDKIKIDFLQRVILVHSYLYYECDSSVWSDRQYDEVAKQLTSIQGRHTVEDIKNKTQYGYCFYDFDGTTGFDLWSRLNRTDSETIERIAKGIIDGTT